AGCGWDASYVSFKCLKVDLSARLDLAVDILLNPTFPEAEWGRIRGQTLAGLQAERDHAESRAYRALLSALYDEGHPYRFPLAGTEVSVEGLTRADLMQFHASFLVAGRSTIIVAGDVDPRSLAAELEARLTSWTGLAGGLPVDPTSPRADHPRVILLDRPGAPQAVVRAGHIGLARSDPAYEHMLVLNQILGGQFSSRLNAKLREERGVTYGVRSSFDCRRQRGPFSISAAVQTSRLALSLDEIYQELAALVGGRPPSQVELDDARRALIEGQARLFETPTALVNRFGSLVVHGLPADHDAGFAERLAAIDLDSLIIAANREIHPGSLVAVVVADAAQVVEDLERLDWAHVESMKDE
ncbi:MAG: M16 family metallopeptidase, partial [Isosphaerales bacterium]